MHTRESITTFGKGLLLAIVLALSPVSSWAQPSMTTVLTNGPTSKRINIVFLSEGYTANELEQFRRDATNTANSLLTVPPFDGFRSYFNAYAIAVASVESGSDHPSTGIARNTYFNSTYESYGTAQLLTIPPNDRDGSYANGQGKVTALLNQFMPEWDIVVLIVNDTVYGGAGGQYMTVSKHASAPEIARHELGHSFAGLGDEYSSERKTMLIRLLVGPLVRTVVMDGWAHDNTAADWKTILNHPSVITLDKMPGWAGYVAPPISVRPHGQAKPGLSAQYHRGYLDLELTGMGAKAVELYGWDGARVAGLNADGPLGPGSHRLPLAGIRKGVYFLRVVSTAGETFTVRSVIMPGS